MNKYLTLSITIILLAIVFISISFLNIKIPAGTDKLIHSLTFFSITLLVIYTYIKFFSKKYLPAFIFILLTLGGVFSALTEKLQDNLINRSCDPIDWLANLTGMIIAVFVFYLFTIKKTLKYNKD
ncbi:MAG: VanZ family protein [Vampirovibrionia bacterium]